jgi:hypothetical protein
VFLQVFQTHVSSFRMPSNVNASFRCFKNRSGANASSGCFKNRSGVTAGDLPAVAGPGLDEGSRKGTSGLCVGSGGVGDVRTACTLTWVCEMVSLALDYKSIYYCIIKKLNN